MLLVLMYHRVHRVAGANVLREHLHALRDCYPLVLPGDPLPQNRLSVCLSFDDATVDFYHEVYPLLQELCCKALVAVPTRYIQPDSDLSMARRLSAQGEASMDGDYSNAGCPLCTWAELRIMQESGLVNCASHSHSHTNLADPETDVISELRRSADLMEQQLGRRPDTFVYPYGGSNRLVQQEAASIYPHTMRIGSAVNRGWNNRGGLLYRVDAEHFWPRGKLWTNYDMLRWRLKYFANRLRGK